jgi:hypothetical protein
MLTNEELEKMRKEAMRTWKYRLRKKYPPAVASYLSQELEGIILFSLTQTARNLEAYTKKTGKEHTAPTHLFHWILKRNVNHFIKREMKHLETESLDALIYPEEEEETTEERENLILCPLPLQNSPEEEI